MLNKSFVFGVNHKNAPVAVRERLSVLSLDNLARHLPAVDELMVLSTCNRFEIYASMPETETESVLRLFENNNESLQNVMYVKQGAEMLRHGFRVAASLDSMVVGEPQILGQMKQAYKMAKRAGKIHGFMDKFCTTALHVGKRVRVETDLAKANVSVASAAVSALMVSNSVVKSGKRTTVLAVGAGNMTRSSLLHLLRYPNVDVLLCNRTFEHAKKLAARYSRVTAVCFEGLEAHLKRCDAVVVATAAQSPVITEEMIRNRMRERPQELTIVDLGLPRNVSPEVQNIQGVKLFDVDALKDVASQGMAKRQSQIHLADAIIEEEIQTFVTWNEARKNVHMVDHWRSSMEAMRQEVLSHAPQASAEEATRLLLNKIMHHPSLVLKAGHVPAVAMENALELLFGVSCPRVRLLPIRGKSDTTSACPFENVQNGAQK